MRLLPDRCRNPREGRRMTLLGEVCDLDPTDLYTGYRYFGGDGEGAVDEREFSYMDRMCDGDGDGTGWPISGDDYRPVKP